MSEAYPSFLKLVKDRGIIVGITKDGGIYTRENIDELSVILPYILKSFLGHSESRKKSERLTDLWKERREKGFKSAVCPAWLMLVNGRYEERPERVRTIRRIFDLAESGLGSPTICKILNTDPEHPPFLHKNGKRGKLWHYTTIDNVLTRRHVLGEFQPHRIVDGEPVPVGNVRVCWYPAVISENQWQKVQALRKTKPKGKRDSKLSNLFQGIMRCAHCDGPMRVKTSKLSSKRTSGSDHSYFICRNAALKNECKGNTYFPIDLVESAILDHTPEYRLSQLFSDPKLAVELRGVEDQIAANNAKVSEVERDTENLKKRLAKYDPNDPVGDSLEETIRTNLIDIETLRKAVNGLEQRRLTLSSRIDQRTDAEGNVRALRADMAKAEGAELLALRAKLSSAVKTFITGITFNSVDPAFVVGLDGNGFKRNHYFRMVREKGRNAGRKIEYYYHSDFDNEEWRKIIFG